MSDQLDLFDTPAHPTTTISVALLSDPGVHTPGKMHSQPRDTEAQAAGRVWPRTGTQRLLVLNAIADAGDDGLTDPEIAQATGLYLYSAAPRRFELLRGGWVHDSGLRRGTGRGGNAIAWTLTLEGRIEWERRHA